MIKSVPHFPGYFCDETGNVYSQKTYKIRRLKPPTSKGHYPHLVLRREMKSVTVLVPHLVAETFLGPRPPGMVINHKDGDKGNSAAQNLEWVTSGENNSHAYRTKLRHRTRADQCYQYKLDDAAISAIRAEGSARKVNGKPTFTGRVNLNPRALDLPLRWKAPRRIFVNSMSDLFHESINDTTIAGIFGIMAACPQHTFQVLTKRPERALRWFQTFGGPMVADAAPVLHEAVKGLMGYGHPKRPAIGNRTVQWPLPNVWLGVSVEDQAAADERIPLLLQTPAAVRFLSCEPLLGSIDVSQYLRGRYVNEAKRFADDTIGCKIDWVIAGGESGPRARPMHRDWARSLRDQCAAAGVPFFFKQWGEHAPNWLLNDDGTEAPGSMWIDRMGKKAAGRLLDGIEHNGMPT